MISGAPERRDTLNLVMEEFFNRVHNTNDGRFGTSGTGGGHYKGRASGAKAPAHSKSSTHKQSTATSGHAAGKAEGKVGQENNSSRYYSTHRKGSVPKKAGKPLASHPNKVSPAGRAQAAETAKKANAPKRDINAEAKAHVAGLVKKFDADRAARKEANKGKPAAAPKKEEGGDTAKLNDIAKLKAQIKANPGSNIRTADYRPDRDGRGGPVTLDKLKKEGGIKYLSQAGPKPAQAKQDAPSKYERSRALKDPKKVKVPLSERLKKFGKFAKKIGEGVAKDNMSGADWKANKERHNPGSTKGQHLTARSAFLTGRQQRNG